MSKQDFGRSSRGDTPQDAQTLEKMCRLMSASEIDFRGRVSGTVQTCFDGFLASPARRRFLRGPSFDTRNAAQVSANPDVETADVDAASIRFAGTALVELSFDMVQLLVNMRDFSADVFGIDRAIRKFLVNMRELPIDVPHFRADVPVSSHSGDLVLNVVIHRPGVPHLVTERTAARIMVEGIMLVAVVMLVMGHSYGREGKRSNGASDGESSSERIFHNSESDIDGRLDVTFLETFNSSHLAIYGPEEWSRIRASAGGGLVHTAFFALPFFGPFGGRICQNCFAV